MKRTERHRRQEMAQKADKPSAHSASQAVPQLTQRAINVNQVLDAAVKHHNAGALDQAAILYRQALEVQGDHPFALHLLGALFSQQGNNDAAIEYISRAIEIKPDLAEAHCNLGFALQARGQLEDAIKSYENALAIKPDLTDAQTNLARAQDQLKWKRIELERFYETMAALRPVLPPHELIRIGGSGDGGYLIPDDLNGVELCFSPGVGTLSNFENELAERGIRCFLADYSVDEPTDLNVLCSFEKKFIGAFNDEKTVTLESWVEASCGDMRPDAVLQMDIEGSEFTSLMATPRSILKMFRIIVLELHFLDNITDPWYLRLFESTVRKLKEDFHFVHLHPNNCCGEFEHGGYVVPRVLECTLMRKDRFEGGSEKYASAFPHPLDQDNVPENDTLVLHRTVYSE